MCKVKKKQSNRICGFWVLNMFETSLCERKMYSVNQ